MESAATFLPALGLVLLGLAASALGSMVGMGGGSFITPFLLIFGGVDPVGAVAASLAAVLASATSSAISHWRAGSLDVANAKIFSVFAVLGAVAGALFLLGMNPGHYPLALGLFLLLTGLVVLRRKPGGFEALGDRIGLAKDYFERRIRVSRLAGTGRVVLVPVQRQKGFALSALAGMASAVFGVGGGSILTPGLILFLKYPPRNAIATSQLVMAAGAAAGLALLLARGQVFPLHALWIALGAWIGGSLGSRAARAANEIFLTRLLAALLVGMGLRLLYSYFNF
jgi:uncharacterized membrane protein YfcA